MKKQLFNVLGPAAGRQHQSDLETWDTTSFSGRQKLLSVQPQFVGSSIVGPLGAMAMVRFLVEAKASLVTPVPARRVQAAGSMLAAEGA